MNIIPDTKTCCWFIEHNGLRKVFADRDEVEEYLDWLDNIKVPAPSEKSTIDSVWAWYFQNCKYIRGHEFEEDGKLRPLTNMEMYWLIQLARDACERMVESELEDISGFATTCFTVDGEPVR
jgi:hypothetical protein